MNTGNVQRKKICIENDIPNIQHRTLSNEHLKIRRSKTEGSTPWHRPNMYKNDEQKQMKKYVYYHPCAALAMQHFYWLHYHKNKPWNKLFVHWAEAKGTNHHMRWARPILWQLKMYFFLNKNSITLCKYLRLYPVVCNDSEHFWTVLRISSRLATFLPLNIGNVLACPDTFLTLQIQTLHLSLSHSCFLLFQMLEMFDGFNIWNVSHMKCEIRILDQWHRQTPIYSRWNKRKMYKTCSLGKIAHFNTFL